MEKECIFCKIASKEIKTDMVFEDDEIVVVKDINAQAPFHLLFMPRKHIGTLNDVSPEDAAMIGRMFFRIKEIAGKGGVADGGYRIVVNCNKDAGQEVFHLHVHLMGGRKFSWPPG